MFCTCSLCICQNYYKQVPRPLLPELLEHFTVVPYCSSNASVYDEPFFVFQIFPRRIDWTGEEHEQTFAELVSNQNKIFLFMFCVSRTECHMKCVSTILSYRC